MDTIRVRVTLRVPIEIVLQGVSPGAEKKAMRQFLSETLAPFGIDIFQVWFEQKALTRYRKILLERLLDLGEEEPA